MMKYVNPTNDLAFRKVLGSNANGIGKTTFCKDPCHLLHRTISGKHCK